MGAMSAGGMMADGADDFDRPRVYYICGGKHTKKFVNLIWV